MAYPLLIFTFILALLAGSECQLTAVLVDGKLPCVISHSAAVYDGDDSIYVFGGSTEPSYPQNKILRYNISSDSVSEVNQLPERTSMGGTAMDRRGNVWHFGGETGKSIYKYDPAANEIKKVGELSGSADYAVAVRVNSTSDRILIIAGRGDSGDQIICYDTQLSAECGNTSLINRFWYPLVIPYEDSVFIVGFPSEGVMEKLNLTTLTSEIITAGVPIFSYSPSTVAAGKYGYILGDYPRNTSIPSLNGMTRFDPLSLEWEFLPLENFPARPGDGILTSAVFVEKLNRIYLIGGYLPNEPRKLDTIYYIQLDDQPTEGPTTSKTTDTTTELTTPIPPLLSCGNRPNGMYPHPLYCAMFIGCHNGSTEIYTCPAPLLFNPEVGTCDLAAHADCDLSCVGKPDGLYPHPHYCSHFVICEKDQIQVFECPAPLLFDPVYIKCNFPEEVDCRSELPMLPLFN